MQAIVPAGEHNPNGHDLDDISTALHGSGGARRWSFRHELLDADNMVIRDLDNVVSASVSQNWLADIKRTARFEIRETNDEIDWLSDRIRPWVRLHLAPYGTSDWVEWPQGVFLLSSPARSSDPTEQVTRQVDGYDLGQLYADDKAGDRYVLPSGSQYTDAVTVLLDTAPTNVTPSPAVLPAAREWDPGISKLARINDLLAAINYDSLSVDEDGTPQAQPYVAPTDRSIEYTYVDDGASVIIPGPEQTLDLFGVPNRWVLAVSQPDRPALVAEFTNDNPASPTSTVRRQRTITDFRTSQDAADQDNLQAMVERIGREASQVYESIEWRSSLMPFHSGNDVYRLVHSALSIDASYVEESWSFDLRAGAEMRHRARRAVEV